MFETQYRWVAARFQNKANQLVVDLVLALAAGYFSLKKYFGWSFTQLLSHIFTPAIMPWVTVPCYVLIFYATVGKVLLLVFNAYPVTQLTSTNPDRLSHCCLRINEEISAHLVSILADLKTASAKFTTNHHFKQNVALAVEMLSEHIVRTVAQARSRDVFISLYEVPSFEDLNSPRNELAYVTHHDPKRDLVHSKRISFVDSVQKNYECVKCVNSTSATSVVFDCSLYEKTPAKRHKSIKHYVGMKLVCGDTLLGFLNIEFHNKKFFASEEEMFDFLESHLVAFRYLIEYQFLKKAFFHTLSVSLIRKSIQG